MAFNFVPRGHLTGSIGTAVKSWLSGHFQSLYASDAILSGTFTGTFIGDGTLVNGVTADVLAGGNDTVIQFNKETVLTGSSVLTYDYTNNVVNLQTGVKHKTTRLTGSSYTILHDDFRIGVPYTVTGTVDIYLPDCANVSGQEFTIKDEGGNCQVNNITLYPSGSQTIDGEDSLIININYTSLKFYNNNNNWFIE